MRVTEWGRDSRGIRIGGNAFTIAPAELGKFGQLYLDGGRRGDRQLLRRLERELLPATRALHE